MDDFVIAVNHEADTSLPYLVRIPLGTDGVVLKTKEVWPSTSKLYCHPAEWPSQPEIVERVAVRTCRRRGAAIDLVLDRPRLNRSQFVFTKGRGRRMIFWQTAKVAKQARPNVALPTARSFGRILTIVVDTGERYAWSFSDQQAEVVRRRLPVGDYAVEGADGRPVGVVERKSLEDLASGLMSGRLRHQAAELAAAPRAAIVVEERYSQLFALQHARPSVVAQALAELMVRIPHVPVVFAENRKLAQEWSYRFLGAALEHAEEDLGAEALVAVLSSAGPLPPAQPTPGEIRTWARAQGLEVSDRGRIAAEVRAAYDQANRRR
ncbi:MAG: ERCC4 domain-containing protein [Euzebya sp.]